MKYQQQGDVIIESCKKPGGALKALPHKVLADGEATGHKHEVIGDATLYMGEDGVLYLKVADDEVTVTHQEHAAQKVARGWKRVRRVREYDHFAEEARIVRD